MTVLTGRYVGTEADLDPGHQLYRRYGDEEAQLLERAKELEPAALGVIYDRYAPRIYNYIFRRLGGSGTLSDEMTAEDLTGEVFLRLLKAIRESKLWNTSFSGWLFRIAHNLVVDHFRKRSRSAGVSLEDVPPLAAADGDPVQITEARLTQERLVLAMHSLTDAQAQVMRLRFVEGLSISEVASAMNRSEGSVKGLQYRAALALRQLLSSPWEQELSAEAHARADGGEHSVRRHPPLLTTRA